ncbi:MAG: hypothetical protein HOP17_00725 [Acidobacteria bacterium]|nr:hypothetical protein [Acidobacteriota bacterium]
MPFKSKVAVTVRVISGIIVSLFGAVGLLFGLIAILDPVGTKMADDPDPFGTPPSRIESALLTLAFAVIAGIGVLIIWVATKKSDK